MQYLTNHYLCLSKYCADPTDYILSIDYVNLDPNPPTAGSNLSITAAGTFAKDVEAGAKVFLQVKFGLITLIKQEADLCDQIGNVDLSCPLKKGPMSFTKTVYKEEVTCLESTVFF